jgi:hypothetical protein
MSDIGTSLGYILDDIGVEGTHRFSTADLSSAGGAGAEFLMTCALLVSRLRFHNPKVGKLVTDPTMREIYASIECLAPLFSVERTECAMGKYRMLHFLCTQLQSARLDANNSEGESRRAQAGQRGKIVFQLDKICQDMSVTPAVENPNEIDIITAIREKLTDVLDTIPNEILSNPPKALTPGIVLSNEQKEMMDKVVDAYYGDFLLRRQMLMKRLDVTIQSFLWGEQAQGKEGEIVAAIQAQRKHLQAEPTRYTHEDAMQAPLSLLHEHAKRVTDQSGKSLVKTVIIGTVPDRGGRANEMRPKARDMGFSRGGGGGGGGGGHNKGGGGGGHNKGNKKGKKGK